MDKFPKVTAVFKDGAFDIKIENWDGMSPMHIERLTYELHKVAHKWRAARLTELYNSQKKASGDAPVKRGTDADFVKELGNALQQGKQNISG